MGSTRYSSGQKNVHKQTKSTKRGQEKLTSNFIALCRVAFSGRYSVPEAFAARPGTLKLCYPTPGYIFFLSLSWTCSKEAAHVMFSEKKEELESFQGHCRPCSNVAISSTLKCPNITSHIFYNPLPLKLCSNVGCVVMWDDWRHRLEHSTSDIISNVHTSPVS